MVISTGEAEGGSESDMESEPVPAAAAGGDVTSERDYEEESKESEVDISMEEQEEASSFKELDLESLKSTPKAEEDSGLVKVEESKVKPGSRDSENMPDIIPVADSDSSKETASLPDPAFAPESITNVKDGGESLSEPAKELPQLQELALAPVPEETKEPEKTEEPAPQLTKVKEEVAVKEELTVEAEVELQPAPPVAPQAVDRQETDKAAPVEDPTIPHLKKIDLDLPPADDKKEGKEKEKLKPGKKMGREAKKSRQNEMRASLSEIPTLEPMTTPSEVKPLRMDVAPSPYDFNDAEAESPSPWQPEITKKWEPSSKPLPAFRDVKMELKKSLETEKKKVKKKTKKATEEAGGEGDKLPPTESPTKPCEKKVKDVPPTTELLLDKGPLKKKGRKKKLADAEVKMPDTSSYEETVNSVVESCKVDQLVHIPLPASLECKEEKPVKKRKKTLEPSPPTKDEERDAVESGKKEPAKAAKGLKGKVGRKKKDMKVLDSVVEQPPADSIPLSFVPLESQTAASTVQREKQLTTQPPEPVPVKQPRLEAELPSGASLTASVPESSTPVPKAGPSGAPLPICMASIRPVPSTSGAAGSGPDERLAPPLEGRSDILKQAGAEPRVDCAGDMPKAACAVGNTVLDNTPPTTPENYLDEANSASSSSEGHDNLKEDLFSLDSGERTSKGGSESPPGCDFSLSSTSSENLPSSSSGVLSSGKPSQSSETLGSKRKRKDDAAAPVKKKKRLVSRGTRGDRNKKSPKCKLFCGG